ncbi:esterase/lipase family protein [Nocardia noduli]|uniref:esterase/lipase family protein n=1 Tax=Nocardia noduli TaxID=2815722 RepID=UPI001C22FF07|nr:hypothetical protein [Nocardia noduli]
MTNNAVRTLIGGLALVLAALTVPAAAARAETHECTPAKEHPNPVIVMPGGGIYSDSGADTAIEFLYGALRRTLREAGFCTVAFPHGIVAGIQGAGPIPDSATAFAAFVDRVRAETGADRVDVVAHSEGALVTNYYAKVLHGAPNLRRIVMFSPVTHGADPAQVAAVIGAGTYPGGPEQLVTDFPVLVQAAGTVLTPFPAAMHCVAGSEVIEAVTRGGITQPGIRYTVLATRKDPFLTPAETTSFIEEPGVLNAYYEDLFPAEAPTTHNTMPSSPSAMNWVQKQLT